MLFLATDIEGGGQLCHDPAWRGLPETQICRGHREHWKKIFFRQGLLKDLSDQAWADCLVESQKMVDTHEN
jgi:hypothetical protein